MNDTVQLEEISGYVKTFFHGHVDPNLFYHNYDHTVNVFKRVNKIASNYQLPAVDIFVLNAAAWFHDTGQLLHYGEGHEKVSATIMRNFFQEKEIEPHIVQSIQQCILATKVPHQASSFLDQVICDADTYNLGTDEFQRTDAVLKQEWEAKGLPTDNWDENTLQLLLHHRFLTPYCQQLLNDIKLKNIALVRRRLAAKSTTTPHE